MATRLRFLLLACIFLACSAGSAFATQTKAHRAGFRLRAHRTAWLRVPPSATGVLAVAYAKNFLGVPYRWGGSTPHGFDCSGLVRYVYKRFGIELPHSSYADFGLGRRVGRWGLEPGDLVFFSGLGHVGLYVGHGRFIHAPHTGTRVQISRLADWRGSYDGARRVVHA